MSSDLEPIMDQEPPISRPQVPTGAPDQPQQTSAPGVLAVRSQRAPLIPGSDEVFRGIYTRASVGLASEIIGICSAIAGEGKTTLALGLAVTMAQDFPDRRILLVETDLQHPVLASDFDVETNPGLAECLQNVNSLDEVVRPTYLDNLDLLPAGGPLGGGGRLLRSSRMAAAADAMRQAYDLVILDLPAILVNSDGLVLTDLSDLLILVVRAGVTPSSSVNKAVEQLDGSKLRGIVLNDSSASTPDWLRRLCGF
jgi:protein-tyrosine kinase